MTQSNSHRVVSEEKGESDTNITHQDDWHGKLSKQVKDLMKKYSEVQKDLEELRKSQPTPPGSASNTKDTYSQKIVALPRERQLKKFGWKGTEH